VTKRLVSPTPAAAPPTPHVIAPNAVYTIAAATRALGLRKNSLPREIRAGRLRVSKRCGHYFVLGSWLLVWLGPGAFRSRPIHQVNGLTKE
jgi:hypothetical protein